MYTEEKQNSPTYQDSSSIEFPQNEREVSTFIKKFYKSDIPLELVVLGSKKKIGKVLQCAKTLNLSKLNSIIEYLPEELYIKVEGFFTCATTALGPMQGLNNIYQEVFNDQGDNPNLLPVIEYTGSEATTWKKGQSRIPQFKIVKWTERPDDWDSLDNAKPEAEAAPVAEEKPQDDIPF